jgi:2-polyprenyl-6-hydroxyphenyl methylase/3-demethylubiquinone-9 3-methyltransferase
LAVCEANLPKSLSVADIGCGAGTQSFLWAQLGHQVHGLDVNEPLIELARQRGTEQGLSIDFQVGSAVSLPWETQSMDICLMPELLEHVGDWRTCLNEAVRVLKPHGILFLTTSNKLCPVQQEYRLPMYSWYPSPVKRYCERLAVTTQPWVVNYAKYPAVNWFSFYELRRVLGKAGFRCFDRFDVMDTSGKGQLSKAVVTCLRACQPLRILAHMATPGTLILAVKDKDVSS